MEQALRSQLLLLADRYTAATSVKPSRIALSAVNDSMFFTRIRRGDGFTVKTFDRVIQWFSTYWPTGLPWPEQIERPEPAKVAA